MSRIESSPPLGGAAANGQTPHAVTDARLVVVAGKASKAEVELDPPVVIGRGPQATLLVKHREISRTHCSITDEDGVLVLRDLKSKNGVFVGGKRVSEAILKPGDTLTVGPLTFRVEYRPGGVDTAIGLPLESLGRADTPPAAAITDEDIDAFLSMEEDPSSAHL